MRKHKAGHGAMPETGGKFPGFFRTGVGRRKKIRTEGRRWFYTKISCRSSLRRRLEPQSLANGIGFRLAMLPSI